MAMKVKTSSATRSYYTRASSGRMRLMGQKASTINVLLFELVLRVAIQRFIMSKAQNIRDASFCSSCSQLHSLAISVLDHLVMNQPLPTFA